MTTVTLYTNQRMTHPAHALRSTDGGLTWDEAGAISMPAVVNTSIQHAEPVRGANGKYYHLLRTVDSQSTRVWEYDADTEVWTELAVLPGRQIELIAAVPYDAVTETSDSIAAGGKAPELLVFGSSYSPSYNTNIARVDLTQSTVTWIEIPMSPAFSYVPTQLRTVRGPTPHYVAVTHNRVYGSTDGATWTEIQHPTSWGSNLNTHVKTVVVGGHDIMIYHRHPTNGDQLHGRLVVDGGEVVIEVLSHPFPADHVNQTVHGIYQTCKRTGTGDFHTSYLVVSSNSINGNYNNTGARLTFVPIASNYGETDATILQLPNQVDKLSLTATNVLSTMWSGVFMTTVPGANSANTWPVTVFRTPPVFNEAP